MIPLNYFLLLAAILFSIGVYGVLTRRNAIVVLMSIELMLNAVNINLVAFSVYPINTIYSTNSGQVFVLLIIAIAAAEVAVGLAILLALYRRSNTIDLTEIKLLRW